MRINRVYTRTGDAGQTRLVGGRPVSKAHPRVEAYGTIDELNAILGIARSFNQSSRAAVDVIGSIDAFLRSLQNDLFNLGAELATLPEDRWPNMPAMTGTDVQRLESWCDKLNEDLGPLREFILPGGGPVGAHLHQARTVCRRAERILVALRESGAEFNEDDLKYLNRLSDFLFILARYSAKGHGEPEYFWERGDG